MKKTLAILLAAAAMTSCFNIRIKDDGLLKISDDAIMLGSFKKIKSEGPAVDKAYPVEAFSAIAANGAFDITVTPSDTMKVEVNAAENIQDVLEINVEDGVLVIGTKDKVEIDKADISVKVPMLTALKVNGASDLEIKGNVAGEEFKLEINGAADVSAEKIACKEASVKINGAGDVNFEEIDVTDLKVSINGAGDVVVTGKAVNVEAKVNGVGEIDATGLEISGDFKKKISGIGSIKR